MIAKGMLSEFEKYLIMPFNKVLEIATRLAEESDVIATEIEMNRLKNKK